MELPPEIWTLVRWVIAGALAVWVHLAILWRVVRAPISPVWRLASIALPPIAPLTAWRLGHRLHVISWVLLVVVYIALRMFSGFA